MFDVPAQVPCYPELGAIACHEGLDGAQPQRRGISSGDILAVGPESNKIAPTMTRKRQPTGKHSVFPAGVHSSAIQTPPDKWRSEGRGWMLATSRAQSNSRKVPELILLLKPSRTRSKRYTAQPLRACARGSTTRGPHKLRWLTPRRGRRWSVPCSSQARVSRKTPRTPTAGL
jgi:hypothetical protein